METWALVVMEGAVHLAPGACLDAKQARDVEGRCQPQQRIAATVAFTAVAPAALDSIDAYYGSVLEVLLLVESDT